MGNQFETEYVCVLDQTNTPHFLMYYYRANLGHSYRSDIYLPNKSSCVHDLFLTDEVDIEGEFLPHVKETEWRDFLPTGPSENVSTILTEAGLSDISISKLIFIYIESSSSMILESAGFVSDAAGVQDFDAGFLNQAISFARGKTGSPAKQEEIVADWIVEQIQNGNFGGCSNK